MDKENIENFQSPGYNFVIQTPCKSDSSKPTSKRASTVTIQSNISQNSEDQDRVSRKSYFLSMQTPYPKSQISFSDSEDNSLENSCKQNQRLHPGFDVNGFYENKNITPIYSNGESSNGSFLKSNNISAINSNLVSNVKWSTERK